MKPDSYKVINRCVEEGVVLGWFHAHKYHEHPDQQHIQNQIVEAVMLQICEYFSFYKDNQID